jgi:hypothetical protein
MAFATWYKIVNYTIWFFRYLVSTIEKLLLHMLNKVPCYKLITFKWNASNSKERRIYE